MNIQEFNEKWNKYLETGHYGLDIENPKVIEYLDKKFLELEKEFPNFQYSQIKLKFGTARVYMEPQQIDTHTIEQSINKIVQNYIDL